MVVNTMTDKELEAELLPEFRHIKAKHKREISPKWIKLISKRDVFPVILKQEYVTNKKNAIRYYGLFPNRKARKEGYMGIMTSTMRTNKGVCTFIYVVFNDIDYIVMIAPHAVNRLIQRADINTTHNDSCDEFVRRFAGDRGCHGYENNDGKIAFYFKEGALFGEKVSEHFYVAKTFVDKDSFFDSQKIESESAYQEYTEMVDDFKKWHRKMVKSY